jgi:peptidoglycan/LPS O-acetylase OafA/YrhL
VAKIAVLGRAGEGRRGALTAYTNGPSSLVDIMNRRIATKLAIAGGSALVLCAALPEFLGGQGSPGLYALGAGLGAAIWLFLDA